ncbi:hypothetical protein GCM10009760_03830 [Kitasatospora kazusensis]|uniref:Uncharacterized protein n=1 Tax=Kitasatospora kazusensis TaxID=407974 RepID=A0ABN2YQA2_9ACTN
MRASVMAPNLAAPPACPPPNFRWSALLPAPLPGTASAIASGCPPAGAGLPVPDSSCRVA